MFNWSTFKAGSKQNHLVVKPLVHENGGLYVVISLTVPELVDEVFDELESLDNVQDLKILNCDLNELPSRIGNLSTLRYLYYEGRELHSLPDTIGNLCNLVALQIKANKLSVLPDSIGNLSRLDRLDLNDNCLTSLSDSVQRLTQLRRLDLSGNRLTHLPENIGNLERLEFLNIANNHIESLPDSMGQLRQLEHLVASGNRISTVPDSIAKLKHLKSLNLENNRLQAIPDGLKVGDLNLAGCTLLTALPEHLRVRGTLDIGGLSLPPPSPTVSYRTLLWNGVGINEQIAFYPETITNEEIYNAANIELRRVMIERVGYDTFISRAEPTTLDSDVDTGGIRRLLWIDVRSDEPLVCLNVKCPSTGRDYFLRVPPTMQTCHQAAAWIAGFDNPDDYQPVMET